MTYSRNPTGVTASPVVPATDTSSHPLPTDPAGEASAPAGAFLGETFNPVRVVPTVTLWDAADSLCASAEAMRGQNGVVAMRNRARFVRHAALAAALGRS